MLIWLARLLVIATGVFIAVAPLLGYSTANLVFAMLVFCGPDLVLQRLGWADQKNGRKRLRVSFSIGGAIAVCLSLAVVGAYTTTIRLALGQHLAPDWHDRGLSDVLLELLVALGLAYAAAYRFSWNSEGFWRAAPFRSECFTPWPAVRSINDGRITLHNGLEFRVRSAPIGWSELLADAEGQGVPVEAMFQGRFVDTGSEALADGRFVLRPMSAYPWTLVIIGSGLGLAVALQSAGALMWGELSGVMILSAGIGMILGTILVFSLVVYHIKYCSFDWSRDEIAFTGFFGRRTIRFADIQTCRFMGEFCVISAGAAGRIIVPTRMHGITQLFQDIERARPDLPRQAEQKLAYAIIARA